MDSMPSLFQWLFAPPADLGPARSVLWWEFRRIPVNLLIAVYGVLALVIFYVAITTSGKLPPGDDAVEPIAIIAAPFVFNLCYTLGWLVEAPARSLYPGLSPRFGPRLLMLGLGFSLCVITVPAAFWAGYRVLLLVHLLR
jgi:hypothetical protein